VKTIASYNVKGGVGKTTAAVNLAHLAAASGRRTLLWDLDPQGAATFLLRVRARVKGGSPKLVRGRRPLLDAIKASDFEGFDLLPADFTYRHMDIDLSDVGPADRRRAGRERPAQTLRRLLAPLQDEYDLVVLDTPPSLSLVSENVLHAADLVLVPLIPTVLSVRTFEQLTAFIADLPAADRPEVRGYFSMVDRRRSLHREILSSLPATRPEMSSTAIPAASVVEQMALRRAPVTAFAPTSPPAQAFRALWAEVAPLLD
jgi:cellulose biosynthesis protein BcsQ